MLSEEFEIKGYNAKLERDPAAFKATKEDLAKLGITRIDTKKNKSYYKTTIFDKIPKSESDIYVITQMGDRLDTLAHQFYGDVNLWWYIAKANGIKDLRVEAGTSLRIPASIEYAVGT